MPIANVFDPYSGGANGGGIPSGGATPPTIAVTGRADGHAYTVTSGARAFSITATAGATLLTTARLASDDSLITVNDNNTTLPSYTAPSGGPEGESVNVTVSATLDGLTTTFSFTERIQSTGLWDMTPIDIDLTDGTWTLYDPDGLVKSITFAGGIHTVTMNALVGSLNYVWGGTTFRGPRWYKPLQISGNQVTADQFTNVQHFYNSTHTLAPYAQRNVFGTTGDPTNINPANAGICGIGVCWQGNGTEMGVFRQSNVYTQSNALHKSAWGQIQRGDNNIGCATSFGLKTGNALGSTSAANIVLPVPGAQVDSDLYLFVASGIKTGSTNIVQDDQIQFSLGYLASTQTGLL